MTNLKTIKLSIKEELNKIEELFLMGLITPKERFSLDFKAKESYKMLVKITKN